MILANMENRDKNGKNEDNELQMAQMKTTEMKSTYHLYLLSSSEMKAENEVDRDQRSIYEEDRRCRKQILIKTKNETPRDQ